MDLPGKYFYIKCSKDHMIAKLYCKDNLAESEINMSESAVKQFLRDNKVVYGIDQPILQLLLTKVSVDSFPYTIATGLPVENGEIKYDLHLDIAIERTSDWNFRDIILYLLLKRDKNWLQYPCRLKERLELM